MSRAPCSCGNTFRIYPSEESETDQLVTKALVLGDFESTVELCLSSERYADALLLAIKGGEDLLQRTQKAYFSRGAVGNTYIRLFESIVNNDRADVVQNADLAEWVDIFVVLCTFASGDEFGRLAEQLGSRLEFQADVLHAQAEEDGADHALELRKTATLTYLAAGRLERLVNIWIREVAEEESRRVQEEDSASDSMYTVHAHALQTFVKNVTVFRAAVKYTDPDLTLPASEGGTSKAYKLAPLYDKYLEYPAMLAAQGLVKEATEYLKLIPQAYTGSAFDSGAIRQRLLIASGESSIRTVVIKDHVSRKAPVSASYMPAAATIARAKTPSQGGQYLPPQPSYQPAQLSHHPEPLKYAPVQPLVRPALLSQPGSPHPARPPVTSAPPPRSQNGGWNDTPVVKADRRTPTSISKQVAIVSPFPHTSQSQSPPGSPFNPGQNVPLPPPPCPASAQNHPPPPPQARVPPLPQSQQPPGPPPHQQPAIGTSPYTPPHSASVQLGQTSGPYTRATPPPGPRRGLPPPPASGNWGGAGMTR